MGVAIATQAVSAVSDLTGLASSVFHTSAAGPNTEAAKAVLPLALAGNLTAVQAIITRTGINTLTSKQPWTAALDALRQAQPDYIRQAGLVNFGFGPGGNAWSRFGAIPPEEVITAVSGANAVFAPYPPSSLGSLVGVGGGSSSGSSATAGVGGSSGGFLGLSGPALILVGLVLVLLFRR